MGIRMLLVDRLGCSSLYGSIDLIELYILVHIRGLGVSFEVNIESDDIGVDIDDADRGGGGSPPQVHIFETELAVLNVSRLKGPTIIWNMVGGSCSLVAKIACPRRCRAQNVMEPSQAKKVRNKNSYA